MIGYIILSMVLINKWALMHGKGNLNNFLEVEFSLREKTLKKTKRIKVSSKLTEFSSTKD